ncbi:CAP domain [Dillenia turbinata]|uniref:CAP domain n=1 Tax=Dillenia turbinata TaxID=194707 RepID=A0AAN8UYF9_9MAGN
MAKFSPSVVSVALALSLLLVQKSAPGRVSPATTPVAAPTAQPPSPAQDFLDAHNKARAEVGVAPLQWNPKLANATSRLVRYQRDKMGCKFAELKSGAYGANQLLASGEAVTPPTVVETWVAEKKYYDYDNNSCVPEHMCGVYTQVVWSRSLELGCAQVGCAKERAFLTICFYFPAGNVVGEKPY